MGEGVYRPDGIAERAYKRGIAEGRGIGLARAAIMAETFGDECALSGPVRAIVRSHMRALAKRLDAASQRAMPEVDDG